jgi:IS30 family transposase
MPASHLMPSAPPLSGRYLAFTDREQIALWRAQGHGVREIARRVARAPSTISRELRRNAARVPAASSTERRRPSGMRIAPRAGPSRRSSRSIRSCANTCRSGWLA